MFAKKSISHMFTVLLIVIFMLTGVLPVQAESPASLRYASGDFLWAKSMGGANYEQGMAVAVDSNGNAYTTGIFKDTADFDPGTGTFNLTGAGDNSNFFSSKSDIFVSKLDGNSNFIWAKRIGGIDDDQGLGIVVDSNGNVYTTGFFQGTVDFDPSPDSTYNLTSAGSFDIFISKLDTNGNFIWANRIGGTNYDEGHGIALDSNNDVYTTGYFEGIVDFDPGTGTINLASAGYEETFISKLDSSGHFVWAKRMGGSSALAIGNGIAVDSSGNVYTTGRFQLTVDFDPGAGIANLTSAGNDDVFVSKLDSSGNFIWAKSMGGLTSGEEANSIAVDSSGNVYTTGFFCNGTADFDPGLGIANLTNAGWYDVFISKLDSNGNYAWAKRIGGSLYDEGYDIAVDSNDNVYTTGFFSYETVDFDPGTGTANLTNMGSQDIFVSKLDSSGNFLWAKSMGGSGGDFARGIALSPVDYIYTTGGYDDIADFDPGVGAANLIPVGSGDIFVSKLSNGDIPPIISSIVRADISPTDATSVNFTVTFSEPVNGVNTASPFSDFDFTTSSGISGASITAVSGSDKTYTVTVNTGTGNGTIHLDVVDHNSILDASSNPLGGAALGDGNFTTGEVYTIYKSAGSDTVGVFRPGNATFYLRNSNSVGAPNITRKFGLKGDYPVVGDWDGNGTDTIGVYRNGVFYLSNSNTTGHIDLTFAFGKAGDQPIAGDWNGDGIDTIGIYRSSKITFLLRNSNSAGPADATFKLGTLGDVGIAGDWNGDGVDTTGVFRPKNGALYLKNANTTGYADTVITYGVKNDKPVTGDWNDDGIASIGIYRNAQFYLRNTNTKGYADFFFAFGANGDMPLAGNWDGIP